MDNIKETSEQAEGNEAAEEIVKPEQQQQKQEDNQLQQQHSPELKQEPPTQQEEEKPIEASAEKPQPPQQQQETPVAVFDENDDDDDDDDDEEKDISQKLVIDIPDEDEVEEKEGDEEEDDDDVIALDDFPEEMVAAKETEKSSLKAEMVEAIITLSDGEEDVPINEAATKPGKVQKRRSMGAGTVTNEEERYRLKRRKINVAGAPKLPLTGYVRYMNDRRDSLRKEHPSKTAMEHTKMIGEEWHALSSDVKSNYLKTADVDKQRYVKELHIFLKSRPDILASEMTRNKIRKTAENNNINNPSTNATTMAQANTTKPLVLKDKLETKESAKLTKDHTSNEIMPIPSTSQQANDKSGNEKKKRKRTPTPTNTATTTANTSSSSSTAVTAASSSSSSNTNITSTTIVASTPGEIPIFTNEFLEHNKICDLELRSHRKLKTDLEQQNSVLEKHVENMKFGVEKMITENNELEEKNRLLEIFLDKLKKRLAVAFAALPLPSAPNGATMDNIDNYMQDLYKMSTSNSHCPATLNKAKDILRKLDLQIQL